MNFSKLTVTSFLSQALLLNLVGTSRVLCATTPLEQQQQEALEGGDYNDKSTNLRGNRFLRNEVDITSPVDNAKQFLVKFKDHDRFMSADMELQGDPHQIMSLPDDDVEVMTFESEEEIQYWEQREDVEYVEPDHKVYPLAEAVPYGINSVKAFRVSDSKISNQKVCIIDTGYDIDHPDLQSSTSIITGHSQVESSWAEDGHGHGTHVAGTIAAIGGNDQGVVGVNRNGQLKLHIVKIFNNDGRWTRTSDLIRAVENCAAAGATVVNMSLGSPWFSQTQSDTMTRLFDQGVLLVAAAGNDGTSNKSYPASYPSVMSVAGVDSSNNKYWGSQFNDQVDIAAPGVGVLSTIPGGRYAKLNGTSMASPHVAGVAALVWSHFPTKTAQQIRQALESTAQDLGSPGRDDVFGHGLVRADLAYESLSSENTDNSFVGTHYYYDADTRHCFELSLSSTSSYAFQDAHGAVESNCNSENFSADFSLGFSSSTSFGDNKFTNGSYCGWWYGYRSSTVTIESTSDVSEPTLSVTEPSTCRYEFVLKVPSAEKPYVHIPNTYCQYYDYGGDGPCQNGRPFNDVWQQCEDDGPEKCMGVMWNSCEGPTSDITVNGAWKLMTAGQEVGDANYPTATCGGKNQALGHWDVFVRK